MAGARRVCICVRDTKPARGGCDNDRKRPALPRVLAARRLGRTISWQSRPDRLATVAARAQPLSRAVLLRVRATVLR